MKNSRYFLTAIAVAVLVLAVIAGFSLREGDQVAASPTPTPTTSTTASATTSAPASVSSASPTASATGGRYVSAGLGYSIETPSPWHKTICSAALVTQQGATPANELFVPVNPRDETGTDMGSPYTTLYVLVEANPQNLSPRQWAEEGRSVGSTAGQRIEDITYVGLPAARKTIPGTDLASYFVANGGRMYVLLPQVRPPLDATTQQTVTRMIESFRFLTAAEQAAARAALPTPLAPRAPEQVADGVAAAMAAKNADGLSGFLSACVTTAGEQAGGSFVSREKYVDDLRVAFAAGLVVTVRARPLDGDRATGNLTIGSTWQDPRGTKERKLMLNRGANDRWEWIGTLERFS